jgi:hypothetical protein
MRTALVLAALACPLAAWSAPQGEEKQDQAKPSIEITGCVRGSTLTETPSRLEGAEPGPTRRWRLRGDKALMKRIKEQEGRELEIRGSIRDDSAASAGRRIGKTNIYIGGDPNSTARARDPLPDLPTIDVRAVEPTGDSCR